MMLVNSVELSKATLRENGYSLGLCGIDFLNFGLVSVRYFGKKSDLVLNEFGSVWLKPRFGSDIIVIYY